MGAYFFRSFFFLSGLSSLNFSWSRFSFWSHFCFSCPSNTTMPSKVPRLPQSEDGLLAFMLAAPPKKSNASAPGAVKESKPEAEKTLMTCQSVCLATSVCVCGGGLLTVKFPKDVSLNQPAGLAFNCSDLTTGSINKQTRKIFFNDAEAQRATMNERSADTVGWDQFLLFPCLSIRWGKGSAAEISAVEVLKCRIMCLLWLANIPSDVCLPFHSLGDTF